MILTDVSYHPDAIDGGRFFEQAAPLRYFIEGNPMGAFAHGLESREDELVIIKQYPGAFFGTSLATTWTAIGIDNLLLTGQTTSGCVRASRRVASAQLLLPMRAATGMRHRMKPICSI